MGWKLSLAVLPRVSDEAALASHLSGLNLSFWHEATLQDALSKKARSAEQVSVGPIRDSTVVISSEIVDAAFEEDSSAFIAKLQTTGIDRAWVFLLHSASNTYGWANFENGQCVRRVLGSSDGRTELGTPQAIEQNTLSQLGLRPHDNASYRDDSGKVWTHDQIGEDVALALVTAVLGVRPDSDDFLMAKTAILTSTARARSPVGGHEFLLRTASILQWNTTATRERWEAQISELKRQIQQGRAQLPGLLSLMPKRREAREGVDPKTGKPVTVPASVTFAARVSQEWQDRNIDQPPETPQGSNDDSRFFEAVAAAVHDFFFQGAPSVELPSLGSLLLERIEPRTATNPRTGAKLVMPGSNRWTFAPNASFSADLQ